MALLFILFQTMAAESRIVSSLVVTAVNGKGTNEGSASDAVGAVGEQPGWQWLPSPSAVSINLLIAATLTLDEILLAKVPNCGALQTPLSTTKDGGTEAHHNPWAAHAQVMAPSCPLCFALTDRRPVAVVASHQFVRLIACNTYKSLGLALVLARRVRDAGYRLNVTSLALTDPCFGLCGVPITRTAWQYFLRFRAGDKDTSMPDSFEECYQLLRDLVLEFLDADPYAICNMCVRTRQYGQHAVLLNNWALAGGGPSACPPLLMSLLQLNEELSRVWVELDPVLGLCLDTVSAHGMHPMMMLVLDNMCDAPVVVEEGKTATEEYERRDRTVLRPWAYGDDTSLPRTWHDPTVVHEEKRSFIKKSFIKKRWNQVAPQNTLLRRAQIYEHFLARVRDVNFLSTPVHARRRVRRDGYPKGNAEATMRGLSVHAFQSVGLVSFLCCALGRGQANASPYAAVRLLQRRWRDIDVLWRFPKRCTPTKLEWLSAVHLVWPALTLNEKRIREKDAKELSEKREKDVKENLRRKRQKNNAKANNTPDVVDQPVDAKQDAKQDTKELSASEKADLKLFGFADPKDGWGLPKFSDGVYPIRTAIDAVIRRRFGAQISALLLGQPLPIFGPRSSLIENGGGDGGDESESEAASTDSSINADWSPSSWFPRVLIPLILAYAMPDSFGAHPPNPEEVFDETVKTLLPTPEANGLAVTETV